jgi:hypothetical protein
MITAQKNGVTRIFGEDQWGNMPKDKFGWKVIDPGNPTAQPNPDIIQKKMVAGQVVDVQKLVPDEIVAAKKGEVTDYTENIPEPVKGLIESEKTPDEIKRKPGRPSK